MGFGHTLLLSEATTWQVQGVFGIAEIKYNIIDKSPAKYEEVN